MNVANVISELGLDGAFRLLKSSELLSPGLTGLLESIYKAYQSESTDREKMSKSIQAALNKLSAKDKEDIVKAIAPTTGFLLAQYANGTFDALFNGGSSSPNGKKGKKGK